MFFEIGVTLPSSGHALPTADMNGAGEFREQEMWSLL
jgi:hypothetical protein